MSLQEVGKVEALLALIALVGPLPCVCGHVSLQRAWQVEDLGALGTRVAVSQRLIQVGPFVFLQVRQLRELLAADQTREGSFPRVDPQMP